MIDIATLTDEEILDLKAKFIEGKLITPNDFFKSFDEYFYKLDINPTTQSHELYLGIPKNWIHDMTMDKYVIELVKENEDGKIIKLRIDSEDFVADLSELTSFAVYIVNRNNAILAKIKEKENELTKMKQLMIEKQMELNREIENLKNITLENEESTEEVVEEKIEVKKEEVSTPKEVVSLTTKKPTIYVPPKTVTEQKVS